MTDQIDIAQLKSKVNIIDVIGRYITLQKRGSEYVAMCCFHNDKNPSLKVNEHKQLWSCFPCGKGGSALDFLLAKGRTMDEAIKELQQLAGEVPFTKSKSHSDEWKQIPAGDDIAFKIKHYKHGEPSTIWRYSDERNQCIGYVCRFDLPEGKETVPFTWCTHINTGKSSWRWHGFSNPRPLYNLYELTQRPEDIVLVVEGEKTADAAKILFPELVVTTWIGGARAYSQTNWRPLHGRKVILCPDHDVPGYEAMAAIAKILFEHCPPIRAVMIPSNFPTHWDLADPLPEQWVELGMKGFLKSNIYQPKR